MARHAKCQWCNVYQRMTVHHVKNRLGDKEEYHGRNSNLVPRVIWVCRTCHDEIERDYELIGKVVSNEIFKNEGTLKGIEYNIPIRMSYIRSRAECDITTLWLQKKIQKVHGRLQCDKSCRTGLYYTQQMNTKPYRECIMKLAIALNQTHLIYSTV